METKLKLIVRKVWHISIAAILAVVSFVVMSNQTLQVGSGYLSIGLKKVEAATARAIQPIIGGGAANHGYYMPVMGTNNASSAIADAQQIVPTDCTFRNSRIYFASALSGYSATYTLYKNGSTTGFSMTVADGQSTGSNTGTVDFSAGDKIVWYVTSSGGGAILGTPKTSIECICDTAGYTIMMGNTRTDLSSSTGYHASLMGGTVTVGSSSNAKQPVPLSGTIRSFTAQLENAPGSGKQFTILLVKNSSATNISVVISGTNTTGTDADTVSITAGDSIYLEFTPASTPAVGSACWGAVLETTDDGLSAIMGTSGDDLMSRTTTEFVNPCQLDGDAIYSAESDANCYMPGTTAKSLYILQSGNSYSNSSTSDWYGYTLRDDGSDTSLRVQITGNNASGNYSTDVSIAAGSLVSIEITPNSSPTARYVYWGISFYALYEETPDISNSPTSEALGTLAESSTYYAKGSAPSNPVVDGECTFTITNNGSGQVDIDIRMTNFTGGAGWTLASSVGSNQVKVTAYYSGQNPASGVVLTTSNQDFYENLAASGTIKWDFKIETGTFTDGTEKTATITLTAVAG